MMDVARFLQVSYVAVAVTILLIKAVSPLRDRFLAYGARSAVAGDVRPQEKAKSDERKDPPKGGILDLIASIQVPHSWFSSFYAFSVASSVFWAHQILFRNFAFRFVAEHSDQSKPSMGMQQVIVVWTMMLVQGLRRLDESVTLTKPSQSKMFVVHWAIGIWFYASTGVAVWIEAMGTLQQRSIQPTDIRLTAPSVRTFVSVILFILASGIQRDCHAYLASLKKYTLPEHPVFSSLVCPHYTAECIIYLALACAAAPPGALLNRTLSCALFFVVANLGVTADGTKKWYETKFGASSVASKWRMVPYVF